MKFSLSAAVLVACAAAAPIIDLSGKTPGDDMVSKIVDVSASAEPGTDWLSRRFIDTAGAGPGDNWATKKKRFVDTSVAGPGDDWLTKRQTTTTGGTAAQQGGGVTGNINGILQAASLGGASGSITQSGGVGAALLSGTGNLASLPATSLGGTAGTGATAQGVGATGSLTPGTAGTATTAGTGTVVSGLGSAVGPAGSVASQGISASL